MCFGLGRTKLTVPLNRVDLSRPPFLLSALVGYFYIWWIKSEFSKGKASCSSPEQSFSWDGCSLLFLEQPCASPLLPAAHRAAWSSLALLRDEGYSWGMALPCRKCSGSITFVWDCVGRRQSSPDGNTAYIGGLQHPYDMSVVRSCVLLSCQTTGRPQKNSSSGSKGTEVCFPLSQASERRHSCWRDVVVGTEQTGPFFRMCWKLRVFPV